MKPITAVPPPEVISYLEMERDAHPYWADIQNQWGLLCLTRGRFVEAREAFDEALSINPNYAWAGLNRCVALQLEGWPEEAFSCLKDQRDPERPARTLTEAWMALTGGDLPRATEALGRIDAGSDRPDAWILRDRLAGPTGAPVPGALIDCRGEMQAVRAAREVLWIPGLYQLWLAASRIQARLGDWPGAEQSARLAFVVFSDLGRYLNHQGFLASLRGDDDAARALYERALHLAPEDPTPAAALARHWSVQDDLERAVEFLQEALRRAPRYADLLRLMAQLEVARGNHEDALRFCRNALEINPRYRSARVEEANILFLLGRWREASAAYRNLVHEGFRSSDILVHLARCEEELGRSREAERAYLEALDLNAEELLAHYRLSLLYRREGREAEAERAWAAALDLNSRPEVRLPVEALLESPQFVDPQWPLPGSRAA